MTIDDLYKSLLEASFNEVLKESVNYFPSRTKGSINLAVVVYNILRKRFDDEFSIDSNQPKVSSSIARSFYCHLRNWLYENRNNVVECLPIIDKIEEHSYSVSRRTGEKMKVSIYTSNKFKTVYYSDPRFIVKDKDNPYNNSVMIGRKLTKDDYKNVMTSVDVCI